MIIELCNYYNVSLNDIYADYLNVDFGKANNSQPQIIGYYQLNNEYRSIIDNNIQFLNNLQNSKK